MMPKVIYMCHKSLKNIKEYSLNWKILNPDYEIELYDDEKCESFLLHEYSKLHRDIFKFIPHGPIKADFWRVCIIYKYGGLYIDADIEPLVPLNEYIDNDDEFVTCISCNFNKDREEFKLNPHFILAEKNNPILKTCIDSYVFLFLNEKHMYSYWRWSICRIMNIYNIQEKKSQILYIRTADKIFKAKFIDELNYEDCEYNGKIVFHNRYKNYSCADHDFSISF
jgi:mannosyltransferase OCH1-like enzyme